MSDTATDKIILEIDFVSSQLTGIETRLKQFNYFNTIKETEITETIAFENYYELFDQLSIAMSKYWQLVNTDCQALKEIKNQYLQADADITEAWTK